VRCSCVREGSDLPQAEIKSAGIERLVVVPCSLDAEPAAVQESNERFAYEVLPKLIAQREPQ
jgi:hypothetical protein